MAQFKSAIGKPIDMTSLASRYENIRAAGNMGVNARGDIINGKNEVILDNNSRISSMYNKTVSQPEHIEQRKSELTPDQTVVRTHTEMDDTLSSEEIELLHDDEVADDFSINDITKTVNQKS